jgi:hypothetical protein
MLTDWIMIVITFIYVIATILICVSNKRSADAAKMQTEEMIKQYNETNRPYVIVRFEVIRGGLLCFVLENVGNMPAYSLNVKMNKAFIDNIPEKDKIMELATADDIYLAPGQKIFVTIGGQPVYDKVSIIPAEFELTYNKEYKGKFVIDLKQYGYMLTYESPEADIANYIKKMLEDNKKLGHQLVQSISELKND